VALLALLYLQAPTLLIVGESDFAGLKSHREALAMLGASRWRLAIER
jgi:hypothetical protein